MHLSLIMATKNRVEQVERFMQALTLQNYQDFDLVIVDQNQDDRLFEVVERYRSQFAITHVTRYQPGTSVARNEGRRHIAPNAELVAFPDDDCVYPAGFLQKVVSFFRSNPEQAVLTTRILALDRDEDAFGFGIHEVGAVDEFWGWSLGVTPGIFLRRAVADTVGFDEDMGPNTPRKSSEDVDFLLRCLDQGAAIYHNPELFVRHPTPDKLYSTQQMIQREFSYGIGFGYLRIKRHMPWWLAFFDIVEPIFMGIASLFKGRWREFFVFPCAAFGRLVGYQHGIKKFGFIRRDIPVKVLNFR